SISAAPRLRSTASGALRRPSRRRSSCSLIIAAEAGSPVGRRSRPSDSTVATAEWPNAIVVTRPVGLVASLPPRARTSCSRRARHAMHAPDDEQGLAGEGIRVVHRAIILAYGPCFETRAPP